ncbi:N-acetylmuramoyl-L-alanine amidase [Bordetella sp. N]|uniref:N-acetylmuramoyl-L-alanine amidase n=1 Tax=Bordetella sp. N TaxID=1746199 RepID=UPI00070E7140|nr:N-acetylmuramoyl-L-alanine amidase [Bordetella sp. N]ALM83029.1 cell wall hydrolase [Bordetella sp. N]
MAAAVMGSATLAQAAYIVVDTGHTPQRPGATGASGRVEYQYNLDLSGAVAHDLMALDDRVKRISVNGKDIALKERPQQAPDADFFISIHHDSMQQAWIDAGRQREFAGFSIFVSQLNPNYEQSLNCAKAIGENLLAAGEKPSLYHATPVPGENRPLIDQRLGIHRFDDLVVLKNATTPAVLVEAGVIVNPDEEKRLADPQTITKLAGAIAQAVHECNQKP